MVTATTMSRDAEVLMPGVVTFSLDSPVETEEAWGEWIKDLTVVAADGSDYKPVGFTSRKYRSPDDPRPAWAGDHFWHLDLMQEGPAVGKLVTAIYYAQAGAGVPGIEVIDRTVLFEAMKADDLFKDNGFDETTLAQLEAEFAYSEYFKSTLPEYAQTAGADERQEIGSFLSKSLQDFNCKNINELVEQSDITYPACRMPLLTPDPFSIEGKRSITFDTDRCRDIIDPQSGASYKELLTAMRAYLSQEAMLRSTGILRTISPETGQVVVISRESDLHRALPGNEQERTIFIGWLATKPEGANL